MVPLRGRRQFLGVVVAVTCLIAGWLVWRQQRLAAIEAAEAEAEAAREQAEEVAGSAAAETESLELALVFFDAKDGAELGVDAAAVEPLNRVCVATWHEVVAQLAPVARIERTAAGAVTVQMALTRPIAEAMQKDFYTRVAQALGGALAASLQANDKVRARIEGRMWLFGRHPITLLLTGDGEELTRAADVRWVSVVEGKPELPRAIEASGRVPRSQLASVFGALAARVMTVAGSGGER